MTKKIFSVGVLLSLMLVLSACGQKGDLYLPPEVNNIQNAQFSYHV
ncbi:MAG: lipoprotein [Pseudomonadota bacterium]